MKEQGEQGHRAQNLVANPHDFQLAPSRLPRGVQWLMVVIFVVAVFISGGFAYTEHWRRATWILGAALIWLAATRLVCDSSVMGVLAVRSRFFDSCYSAALGVSLLFLAYSVDSLGS